MITIPCPYCSNRRPFESILGECICRGTQYLIAEQIRPMTEEEIKNDYLAITNQESGYNTLRHMPDPFENWSKNENKTH